MNLRGKTALVTGGATRLGRAICAALAAHGCSVAIHCRRSERQARALAALIRRKGGRAIVVPGDLCPPGACERIVAESVRMAGRLDILVNNAAIFRRQSLLDAAEADFREALEINCLAPLRLIRAFARQARGGAIVNLLDCRTALGMAGAAPYILSKNALAGLTRIAALELAPSITVNGVAPGAVLPPVDRETPREKAGTIPLGRKPSVADLVRAVVFLLESDSITGQIVYVDGGRHLLGGAE